MGRRFASVFSAVFLAGIVGCGPPAKEESPAPAGTDARQRRDAGSGRSEEAGGVRYELDPAQSRMTAHVGVGGLLAAAGHEHTIAIREFRGGMQSDAETLQPASLRLMIRSSSLAETGKEFDAGQRRKVDEDVHARALETSRFPEIVFQGNAESVRQAGEGQLEAVVRGDLTLHGVTRQISFPVKVRRKGDALRASGEFTILHSAYNIKRLSAGGGMVKAKDEIVVSFDVLANRVKS